MVDPCSHVVRRKCCLSFPSFVLFESNSVASTDPTYITDFNEIKLIGVVMKLPSSLYSHKKHSE